MSGGSLAVAAASRALDGLTMRMAAIADNLANVNSPTFRPLKVEFEAALRAAAQGGPDAVAAADFKFEAGPAFASGDDRRMDLLLADAAQTANRYAALADMLGRRLAIHQAAMRTQG